MHQIKGQSSRETATAAHVAAAAVVKRRHPLDGPMAGSQMWQEETVAIVCIGNKTICKVHEYKMNCDNMKFSTHTHSRSHRKCPATKGLRYIHIHIVYSIVIELHSHSLPHKYSFSTLVHYMFADFISIILFGHKSSY